MLLLLTLAFSFTGYLLPWDQLAYWAVTVGTNLVHYVPLVGGDAAGPADRRRPGRPEHAAALLRAARRRAARRCSSLMLCRPHLARAQGRLRGGAHRAPATFAEEATERPRRAGRGAGAGRRRSSTAGGSGCSASSTASRSPPRSGRSTTRCSPGRTCSCATSWSRSAWPRSCSRLGVAFAAPLRGLANPNLTPEPAKAPWYFAGLQELLSHFDPLVAGILVPVGAVLTLVLLPYIDRNPATVARHRKVAIVLFSGLLAIAVVLTVDRHVLPRPGLAVHRAVDPLVRRALGGT